jgi:hypothetical protein
VGNHFVVVPEWSMVPLATVAPPAAPARRRRRR